MDAQHLSNLKQNRAALKERIAAAKPEDQEELRRQIAELDQELAKAEQPDPAQARVAPKQPDPKPAQATNTSDPAAGRPVGAMHSGEVKPGDRKP